MSTYEKPYLTFEEQLDLLESRGLHVSDRAAALSCLQRIGYYRLSAYWYPFRVITHRPIDGALPGASLRADVFRSNSSFEQAMALYVFDKRLRLLLLDAIERIEVAMRVDVSYLLGARDAFAHMRPDLLHGNFTKKTDHNGRTGYAIWCEKYAQAVTRSREDFVRHYQQKYGEPFPIWVAVELWEFGMLSKFFEGMHVSDRNAIARQYGVPDGHLLGSWLRALNFVRNVAVHHGRLWNRNLVDQPRLPAAGTMPWFDPFIGQRGVTSRVFVMLCIVQYFMRIVSPTSHWPDRLRGLLDGFPSAPGLSLRDMGFPEDWKEQPLWR